MNIKILDKARDDLVEGYQFYESCEAGLGNYFLSNLYSDIEGLKTFAGIHPVVYKGWYRNLSKRFPFAIYYSMEENNVYIRSIIDCRRSPSWIHNHLDQA